MSEAAWRAELGFVDSIWPKIKDAIDGSIFAVDTSSPGVEGALKVAADIALTKWREAQAVSLPDRTTLIMVISKAMLNSWSDAREYEDSPEAIADAVLAALSNSPEVPDSSRPRHPDRDIEHDLKLAAGLDHTDIVKNDFAVYYLVKRLAAHLSAQTVSVPEIPDNSTDLVSALRSRLSVAEAIISRARHCVREEYARDQIVAVLSNPLPSLPDMAALSTQPAAGEVEWGVLFRSDGRVEKRASREKATERASEFTRIETRDGKLVREIPPSDSERGRALVSRTVTPWIEVQS